MKVKRVMLLVVATFLVAALCAPSASAQACFDELAQRGIPPGEFVSGTAVRLAEPGTPMSLVDEAANEIGLANKVREDVCQ
jgi:hypothetical protein